MAEAVAAGFGYRNHAALMAGLSLASPAPLLASLQEDRLLERLGELTGELPAEARSVVTAGIGLALVPGDNQEEGKPDAREYAHWRLGEQPKRLGELAWVKALDAVCPGLAACMDADETLHPASAALDVPLHALPEGMAAAIVADPGRAADAVERGLAASLPLSLRHMLSGDHASVRPVPRNPVTCLIGLVALVSGEIPLGDLMFHGSPTLSELGTLAREMLGWGAEPWSTVPDPARAVFLATLLGGQDRGFLDNALLVRNGRDSKALLAAVADAPDDCLADLVRAWLRRFEGGGPRSPARADVMWRAALENVITRGLSLDGMELGGVRGMPLKDLPVVMALRGLGLSVPPAVATAASAMEGSGDFAGRLSRDEARERFLEMVENLDVACVSMTLATALAFSDDKATREALARMMDLVLYPARDEALACLRGERGRNRPPSDTRGGSRGGREQVRRRPDRCPDAASQGPTHPSVPGFPIRRRKGRNGDCRHPRRVARSAQKLPCRQEGA